VAAMLLRVVSWNLMHGRAVPPGGRDLFEDFAAALRSWSWDVALLQEVPPWWPAALAAELHSDRRLVLTSRNALLPVRKAIAVRWPDLIKSNGGGCNAILARRGTVVVHRMRRLSLLPERRWLQAVRIAGADVDGGLWVGNLHATVHNARAALHESCAAAETILGWAGGEPVVLGGDFNLRGLDLDGFLHAAGHDVDHVFAAGLGVISEAEVLDRGRLSDHAPVAVTVGAS
jgi:endonuclease/exonuclease/phosphatase family metal-dependent hydrolase